MNITNYENPKDIPALCPLPAIASSGPLSLSDKNYKTIPSFPKEATVLIFVTDSWTRDIELL